MGSRGGARSKGNLPWRLIQEKLRLLCPKDYPCSNKKLGAEQGSRRGTLQGSWNSRTASYRRRSLKATPRS